MNIKQSEIWMVCFEPSVGNEIQKLRPALIVSDDTIGRFGLRTVVPITEWKDRYENYPWILKINNFKKNGLTKNSSIECFQVKNFAEERFIKKIGEIDKELLYIVHSTILKTLNPRYNIR